MLSAANTVAFVAIYNPKYLIPPKPTAFVPVEVGVRVGSIT
jgi:hypothetical protein